jgi:acyl-CoA synthetase (AMP-forming)/AMP-acid ligase II
MVLPSNPPVSAASIVEVLRARADTAPDSLAFSFLTDGEEEGSRLTYGDLDLQARTVAATLRDGAEAGDRALLLYAPGLEFIPAFFGCLYAGVVPVPAYPPRLDRLIQSWQALGNIAADCQPKVVLTTRNVAALFGGSAAVPHLGALPWICTDDLDWSRAQSWHEPRINPDALALLQYTSGSTATPKGVMVTHRNLMHNQRTIAAAVAPEGPGLGVSWLPLYHDMGLLGGVIQPLFSGTPCVLMSPLGILQKPIRWLKAITRYRARSSGAPNFAYELCAQRIAAEQKAELDLSSWAIADVGGETVSSRTLERFAAAFAPCGFHPEAFVPCYGLAEATLLVAANGVGVIPTVRSISAAALDQGEVVTTEAGSSGTRSFVGCGRPWLETRLVIAHPEEQTLCPAGSVGEIWVAGPSVAVGYWGRPEETERTFRAYLKDSGDGPFLRTGDLGFLQDGELFVTGRLKDLIVFRGRNHYPQDIEQTVQSVHPALREGCGAAFETYKNGQPRLVIVQEVERRSRDLDAERLLGDVRQAVADHHELHVHDLVLLEPGSLPKTSSGKVQRHRCRLGYEQGTLRQWKRSKS